MISRLVGFKNTNKAIKKGYRCMNPKTESAALLPNSLIFAL